MAMVSIAPIAARMPNQPVQPPRQLRLAAAPHVVDADGNAVALAARDAALLAWLALEGPTPRARLAQLLWPDSDADAARNALRQRLFQLRKSLGLDAVVGSTTLALAAGLSHDLEDADSVLGDTAPVVAGEFAAWLESSATAAAGACINRWPSWRRWPKMPATGAMP